MSPELLLDESVDARIGARLRAEGFLVVCCSTDMRGAPDSEVLATARKRGMLVVTEDSDFGELVFAHRLATAGVLYLRYPINQRVALTDALVQILRTRGDGLRGAFSVVTPTKVRVRRL